MLYAASAGSGKTFALVKRYLTQLLIPAATDSYRSLLAITFTNKAVAEMKSRILQQLDHFTKYQEKDKLTAMQHEVCAALDIKAPELARRSQGVLKDLLHNYGAFAVETIDSFNHRLLRTFARDLGLRSDFEVTTEADLLLQEAVDAVLAQTGEDEFLTETLVNFALQNTEEDRSWDPSGPLLDKAKVLLFEDSIEPVKRLQEKSTEDLKTLTKLLEKRRSETQNSLINIAKETLQRIADSQLEVSHFNRGSYPNHMIKLRDGQAVKWDNKWQLDIENYNFYTQKQEAWVKDAIDAMREQLIALFYQAKEYAIATDWYQRLYREVVPMTLLNYVQKAYQNIKDDQNLVTVAEFNRRIHNEIKAQPAPFIYERLGERYRHFFIDEFQDTSSMQWNNLVPLVDNALSQQDRTDQQGTLLLVGDAKQSIYRWRGGLPEQFLDLSEGQTPFAIAASLHKLRRNWRSRKEVIDFNNKLFKHLGTYLAEGPYRDCYLEQAEQEFNDKKGGQVTLEFFEAQNKEERDPEYIDRVKAKIDSCLEQGYALKDICVLTRKKDDSKTLAQALQEDYAVVSPDSLLLKESTLVQLLICGLQLRDKAADAEIRLALLWNYLEITGAEGQNHTLFKMVIADSNDALQQTLEALRLDFSLDHMNSLGLYESLEYLIRSFKLQPYITAYERHFLDLARNFEQHNSSATTNFLEDWKKQEDAASLQFPENLDAIRLMTVHKSKGLEFPVVIIPFTDADLINKRNEYLWYAVDPQHYCGFEEFHLPINAIKETDTETYERFLEQRFFDELNVWYVALSRAEDQLHLISSSTKADQKTFGGLVRSYLEACEPERADQNSLTWGTPVVPEQQQKATEEAPSAYISSDKSANKIRLIASPRDKYQKETRAAQDRGNRLHLWLSQIASEEELPLLFERLEVLARYSREQLATDRALLEKLIQHPEVAPYFRVGVEAKNEAAIIDSSGEIHRPDRLVIDTDSVVIIDYKFGSPDPTYRAQLDRYQDALQQLGFKKFKKILVYVQEEIELDTW